MADFDPDAFLAEGGGTAVAEFDPDKFLAEPAAEAPAFDPDAFLAEGQPQSSAVGDFARRVPAGIASAASQVGQFLLYGMQKDPTGFGQLLKDTGAGEVVRGELRDIQDRAAADYGVDPERDQQFASKVAGGIGSIVPIIASGPLAPLTASALMGESQRQDAEAHGAGEGAQLAAAGLGAGVGLLSEALMGLPQLMRVAKTIAPAATSTTRAIGEQALRTAGREATQESLEQTAQNLIANTAVGYDPERKTGEGVIEAALVGAVVGGPLGATTQAAVSIDQKQATAAQPPLAPLTVPEDEISTGPAPTTEAPPAAPQTQPTPAQPPPVPPIKAPPAAPPVDVAPISVGPGAASSSEELATYEPRRFSERFQEDFQIEPSVREATGNRYYEPIPNKITVSDAESIIETRGIDESSRLVRDESINMEPRVRATMGQGLIRKLNKSYAEAKTAGDPNAGRYLDQAVDTAEYLGELGTRLGQGVQSFAIWSRLTPEGMLLSAKRAVSKGRAEFETQNAEPLKELIDAVNAAPAGKKTAVIIRISKTNPVAKKVKGDAAKIAEMAAKNELTKEGFYDAVSERLGVPTLRKDAVAKISEMSAEIESAPEGFQRDEKTIKLLSYITTLKGADLSEIPTAMFYANILSGFTTQLVNTVDTSINVLSEAAIMTAINPASAPDILSGLYQGLLKGSVEAAMILKSGKTPTENKLRVPQILERTEFGKEGGVPISEATALGRFMKHALEAKAAKPLNLWKYPLRAMVASDTVLFNSFKEARVRLLSRTLAEKEGLSNDALFRRVDELLNRGTTPEAAAQQAASEGLTGLRAKRRAGEIVDQGRPEALIESAEEAARIATYNYEPVGVLGLFANKIGSIVSNFKPAVAIVPFTRIVANVTNRGLDYTPWGYKRLFFGHSGGKGFETKAPVNEAFKAQLVKATLGTVAMATVATLDATGKIMLSASGPDDPDERNQLKNAGWKPYSIKIGDTYYSYQYTPFNLAFAIVGHYRDAVRYGKLGEQDALSRVAYSLWGSGKSVFEMSFLSGVGDFIESLKGGAGSTKAAGRIISRTVSSAVIPNLAKQIDRVFDPTIYKADTVTEGLIRETPVARHSLLPMVNVLGERIEYSQNRFFSKAKPDPVWAFIVEKQAWISVPSKTSKVGNRPISSREYYELVKQSGPKIRQYIEKNLPELQKKSKEDARDAIRDHAQAIRANIKGKFKASDPLK